MSLKNSLIPLSSPKLNGNEKKYLINCIKTNYVSSIGNYVKKFEKKISKFLNINYSVTCNSGTTALHLALLSLGVKSSHEIIIPTLSFIATANAVSYVNASPIFMDCDKYFNIDVHKLTEFLDNETYQKKGFCFNKSTNRRIFAVIVVHVFGNAANIYKLIKICKKKNIKIIEDAAGAFGTKYLKGKLKNKYAGTIGDIGCVSFNGNKIITCGGGGAILTNKKKYYEKSIYLANQAYDNKLDYTHNDIGYNFKLTNIQAAVGLAQLEKINVFLKNNLRHYNFYEKNLIRNKYISFNSKPDYAKNNNWLLSINLNKRKNKKFSKKAIIDYFSKSKIEVRSIWKPLHLQKKYKNFQKYKITNAKKIFDNTINIPSGNNIKKSQIKKIIKKINDIC